MNSIITSTAILRNESPPISDRKAKEEAAKKRRKKFNLAMFRMKIRGGIKIEF